MRLREVAKATGLDDDTIRRLERKGVIKATRDANGHRVFDSSVVAFLRERYKDRMQPKTSPQYDLKINAAGPGEKCPQCQGSLTFKGALYATQSMDPMELLHAVSGKLWALDQASPDGCKLIDAWVHRTQVPPEAGWYDRETGEPFVRQDAPDDSLRNWGMLICQRVLWSTDGEPPVARKMILGWDDLRQPVEAQC